MKTTEEIDHDFEVKQARTLFWEKYSMLPTLAELDEMLEHNEVFLNDFNMDRHMLAVA
jgi:hypothetical protein